jgi:hypothetical protein
MFRFSSAGASPDKGGALAFVSIRSFGFFFTCGIELIDREPFVAARQEESTNTQNDKSQMTHAKYLGE